MVPPAIAVVQFTPLAHHLARRFAEVPGEHEDLAQEGLWALAQAWTRTPSPDHPLGFARAVMMRAMLRYYDREHRRQPPLAFSLDCPEPSLLDLLPSTPGSSIWHGLELRDYFDAVDRALGPTVRWIAENLVHPGEDFGAFLQSEMDHKWEVRNRRRRRGVPQQKCPKGMIHSARQSNRQLRQALGWSIDRWSRTLASLRDFTRQWLQLQ